MGSKLERASIYLDRKESLFELENQVSKEQLILCDSMQNTFLILNYNNGQNKIGIAYYDYGVELDFQYSKDETLLYVGVGENLLVISIFEGKLIFNHRLQSVFYELICDTNKNYICAICELDVYCYCGKSQKWKMGFRDIINSYNIIDNMNVLIACNDGMEYSFSLEDGKMII